MAKSIKKSRKNMTPEQKAERKAFYDALKAKRLETAKAKYAKNPQEFIVYVKNRKVLAAVMNKPITWPEFCSLKQTTCGQYWAAQSQKPERTLKVRVLTAEQVDEKKAKLAKMVARIEAQKAQLAEAMKLLGK